LNTSEKTILGLDISTSITGATILQDGKIIESLFWDTRNKRLFPTFYEKAKFIKNKLIEMYQKLIENNFPVGMIHGSLQTNEREYTVKKFREGEIRILLSTDLLSRGIDVQQLSLVINFDLPREKETYIHRIGRSGRYGRKGVAINFITDYDLDHLNAIQEYYNTKIEEMPQDIQNVINV